MPANETERTLVLKQYEILLPIPDRTLDRITALAARLFDVPVAVIGIVDSDHIRLVSGCGLETTEIGFVPEYPAITMLRDAPYIVANTKIDTSPLTKTLAGNGSFLKSFRRYSAAVESRFYSVRFA